MHLTDESNDEQKSELKIIKEYVDDLQNDEEYPITYIVYII